MVLNELYQRFTSAKKYMVLQNKGAVSDAGDGMTSVFSEAIKNHFGLASSFVDYLINNSLSEKVIAQVGLTGLPRAEKKYSFWKCHPESSKLVIIIKNLICLVCFLTAFCNTYAQPSIGYGIKAGVTRSSISDLETTILSEPYFLNYTLKAERKYGWTAGMFLNYPLIEDILVIQTDMTYAQQGSDLLFNNTEKDFNYKMQFKYQYFNLSGQLKIYPFPIYNIWQGLNIGVGPQLGFNLAPQNIIYTSGGKGRLDAFGSDLQQQQQLRNVLKGQNNFGLNFSLCYEFRKPDNDYSKTGLTLELMYHFGLTDAVETQVNSYNFIENKNTIKTIQFTIGWDFSVFEK